jgi:hypothetical protein
MISYAPVFASVCKFVGFRLTLGGSAYGSIPYCSQQAAFGTRRAEEDPEATDVDI